MVVELASLAELHNRLERVLFDIDLAEASAAERDALRSLRREPQIPWEVDELAALTDVVRLLVQLQADLTYDPEGGMEIAKRIRSLVELVADDRARLYGLRATAAEISAGTYHRAGHYDMSGQLAWAAETLARDVEDPVRALVVTRRARALRVAAMREPARDDTVRRTVMTDLILDAEYLYPDGTPPDPFDHLGLNQLASQLFYGSAQLGDVETADRWFDRAIGARTDAARHQATLLLLEAAHHRLHGRTSPAEAAEAEGRRRLEAYGLLRHIASLSWRGIWPNAS